MQKQSRNEKVVLCFAEFDTPFQATVVINTLQVSEIVFLTAV
jgi:hypothetical protein